MDYDALTIRAPQRSRWYTRLWPACLGCGFLGRRQQRFPLYLIGYDPVGRLQRTASAGDVKLMKSLINADEHHVNEHNRRGSGGAAAVESEQSMKKCASFNKGENFNTAINPPCSARRPARRLKSLLKKSFQIKRDENFSTAINPSCSAIRPARRLRSLLKKSFQIKRDENFNTAVNPSCSARRPARRLRSLLKKSFQIKRDENFNTAVNPSCSARRPARRLRSLLKKSFQIKRGSRRPKDQVSLSEGTMKREPEQRKKKHVTFNKEVHYNTSKKPFCRGKRPPGELKSILKKSLQISGDNGRNQDQISLGLSENPHVTTEDTATTAIKEDIDNSSSRYTVETKTPVNGLSIRTAITSLLLLILSMQPVAAVGGFDDAVGMEPNLEILHS